MAASIRGTSDQIADILRREIEDGHLLPGAALNQVAIAARFDLSRIPVREALRLLEAEGYLTSRPNKRVLVAPAPTPKEMLEIIEVREALELRLMRRVTHNASDEILDRARKAMDAMNAAHDEGSLRGSHERFHSVLFEAGDRPMTAGLVNGWRFRLHFDHQQAFLRRTADIHAKLLVAVAAKDFRIVTACVRQEYAIMRDAVPASTSARLEY